MDIQTVLYKIISDISEIKKILQDKGQLNKDLLNIIPVSEFNNYYPYPKEGAIRQYIFHNRDNFCDLVVVYSGGRQCIDVNALIKWLKRNNQKMADKIESHN
jgi:hypothetical protein